MNAAQEKSIDGATSDTIRAELPEIDLLTDSAMQDAVVRVWAELLEESGYDRIGDCPAFPGISAKRYDLARHTRHSVRNCIHLADTLKEFWDIDCNRDILLAASLCHDVSKLNEYEGEMGTATDIGRSMLHAQLGGVRCRDVGLPPEVVYIVSYHPFHPPHIHLKPKSLEFVILACAEHGGADPVFFAEGEPTHLDIDKRFFSL